MRLRVVLLNSQMTRRLLMAAAPLLLLLLCDCLLCLSCTDLLLPGLHNSA
jgi:hypothetical protein